MAAVEVATVENLAALGIDDGVVVDPLTSISSTRWAKSRVSARVPIT